MAFLSPTINEFKVCMLGKQVVILQHSIKINIPLPLFVLYLLLQQSSVAYLGAQTKWLSGELAAPWQPFLSFFSQSQRQCALFLFSQGTRGSVAMFPRQRGNRHKQSGLFLHSSTFLTSIISYCFNLIFMHSPIHLYFPNSFFLNLLILLLIGSLLSVNELPQMNSLWEKTFLL